MRAILIDWLVEVHFKLNLKIETLYLTIWIIDTFLSYKIIKRSRLQLVGTASLLISCKYNDIYYPNVFEFIKLTDNSYKKSELLDMEKQILEVMKFNICIPTSIHFYQIISNFFELDEKLLNLGKYFLENTLLDYDMLKFSPSILAISSIYIIMKYSCSKNYKYLYKIHYFIPKKILKKTIIDCSKKICLGVKNLSKSNLQNIKKKYSLKQYFCVTNFCE